MTKSTIIRIWTTGLIVLVVGLIVGGVSLGLMLAYGGHFTAATHGNGFDFVPTINGFFWTMIGLMIAGFTVAAAGGIVQLAGWIGALVNTYLMQDKTWFVVLLAGGLLGFGFALLGFAAMVAYVVAGPDGMTGQRSQIPTAPLRTTTLAPAS